MSWQNWHRKSEILAINATLLFHSGQTDKALRCYRLAARFEERALNGLPSHTPRTFGIMAVSAVSLLVKSHEYARAKRVASRILDHGNLPTFARDTLQSLLMNLEMDKVSEVSPFRSSEDRESFHFHVSAQGCRHTVSIGPNDTGMTYPAAMRKLT